MQIYLRHILAGLALLLVMIAGAPSFALTDEEKEALKAAVTEGSEAYNDGRFLDAVDAFERAEKISENTRVQYNLARALEEAGLCQRAMKRYELLVENKETEKVVRERSKAKVDDGLECTSRGEVAIVCETANVTVNFDGAPVECGSTVRKETAERTWSATAPGFMPAQGKLNMVEGESVTLVIGLTPAATADSSSWMAFTGIGMAAVGVGLLAVGVVSDTTANQRSELIVDAAADGDRERLQVLQEDSNAALTQTIVLYSAGAALLTGGAVLLVLHLAQDEEPVAIRPGIGPDGATVQARWRW